MKSVLVTGGLGFIGSHTCVELLNDGYNVIVIDNLSNSKEEVREQIEKITGSKLKFIKLDLTNYEDLEVVFSTNSIDSIIHFAAYKAVGESVDEPLKYYQNNLISLMNLLQLCKKNKVSRFVFSSSCTVYGQPDNLPVTETFPTLKAASPYGNTKRISEEIIQDFCYANNDFKAISLRYFNPIGAHETGLIGELPLGVPNNLVPFITQTAVGLRKKLKVFGGDYKTSDGTCVRDYIHVVDLAKAHIAATQYASEMELNYDSINVGTGKGYTVLEVVKSFEKISGLNLNYEIVERREGDVEQIFADTSKANNLLNWHAELDLDAMLSSAWRWQKNLENK